MSERISVNQAFDPEERRAQQEFDAFIDSRPYKDEKGNVHHPETGKFVDYDAYHETERETQYDATLKETDYRGESLEALAHRVAEARAEGDKTQALDAEEAFFDKFNAYSEKYGWEQDDDSATDEVRLDKDASLTRTTIDDRLARYTAIMYGDDMSKDEQPSPSETITAPLSEKTEVPDETSVDKGETRVETRPLGAAVWKNADNDMPIVVTGYLPIGKDGREYVSVEGSGTGVPLDEIEFVHAETPEAEESTQNSSSKQFEQSEPFDVDKASQEARDRVAQIGADKQKEWEDKVAAEEAARQAKEATDIEAAGAVVIPPLNIDSHSESDDGLEPSISGDEVIPPLNIDSPEDNTILEVSPRKKRFGEHIHDAFAGARNAYLRAGARLQNRAATTERNFHEENGRVVEDGAKEKDRRKLKAGVLAVGAFAAGIAGVYIANRHGFGGHSMFGNAHLDADALPKPSVGGGSNGSPHVHEVIKSIAENYSVKPGEGYDRLLTDNGIKPTPELLEKIKNSHDPSIRAWTYVMRDGNPGLSHSGQMPANVIESIKKLR